jgi:hypothetical protein
MHSFKRVAALAASFIVAMFIMAPPSVEGQRWDKETRFSINHQFEVPGAVLEANTQYVMRLHDFESGTRNVVQVLTPDGHLVAQFMGIHDFKLEAPDNTEFTFYETASMYPKALRSWFYPGANNGLEFLYPEDQMATIVAHRVAPAEVQTAAVIEPEVVPEPEAVQPVPEPEVDQTAELPQEQEQSTVTEEQLPQIAQNDTEQPATDQTPARELPRTAGELPMIGLIGMLCLGFGLGLRVLSARS